MISVYQNQYCKSTGNDKDFTLDQSDQGRRVLSSGSHVYVQDSQIRAWLLSGLQETRW